MNWPQPPQCHSEFTTIGFCVYVYVRFNDHDREGFYAFCFRVVVFFPLFVINLWNMPNPRGLVSLLCNECVSGKKKSLAFAEALAQLETESDMRKWVLSNCSAMWVHSKWNKWSDSFDPWDFFLNGGVMMQSGKCMQQRCWQRSLCALLTSKYVTSCSHRAAPHQIPCCIVPL